MNALIGFFGAAILIGWGWWLRGIYDRSKRELEDAEEQFQSLREGETDR